MINHYKLFYRTRLYTTTITLLLLVIILRLARFFYDWKNWWSRKLLNINKKLNKNDYKTAQTAQT